MAKPETVSKNFALKLLKHPDADEIIARLSTGFSSEDVAGFTLSKYPDNKEMVFSAPLLEKFRDVYIDVINTIKQDVKKVKEEKDKQGEVDKLELAVKNNKTYRSAVINLAEQQVNIKEMATRAVLAAEARLEQIYDLIQQNPEFVTRNERILMEWFDRFGTTMDRYCKIVEEKPDHIIQHNISESAITKQTLMIQECIVATLSEIDSNAALIFQRKIVEKMGGLQFDDVQLNKNELILNEAKAINEDVFKRLNE